MPYTLKHIKLNLLHLKRVLKTLKSLKYDLPSPQIPCTFKYLKLDLLHLKIILKTLKSLKYDLPSPQMYLTLSKKLLNTQASQVICYWSLNTFKTLKEIFEPSKHSRNLDHMLLHQTYIRAKTKTKKYLQQPIAPSNTSNTMKLQNANPSRSTMQPQSNEISRHFNCIAGP
jgi:hypothetical protein